MAKLANAADSKSVARWACGFDSHQGYKFDILMVVCYTCRVKERCEYFFCR